jgi:hypothetical protein
MLTKGYIHVKLHRKHAGKHWQGIASSTLPLLKESALQCTKTVASRVTHCMGTYLTGSMQSHISAQI